MEYLCPLCNGIENASVRCEICNAQMDDAGRIQDFFDDYSPYLDNDITGLADGVSNDQCLHIFVCPRCGNDCRVAVNRVEY